MPARTIVDCQKYLLMPNCAAILTCSQPIRECTAPRYLGKADSLRGASDLQTLSWSNFNPERVNKFLLIVFTSPTVVYTNALSLPSLVNDKCVHSFDDTLTRLQCRPQSIFIKEICFRKCMLLGPDCADILSKLINLEYVDISFTAINGLGKFRSLTWLKELLADSVVDLTEEKLDGLQYCNYLETLDISGTNLVRKNHAQLPKDAGILTQFKSLKRLFIRCASTSFNASGMASVIELDVGHQNGSQYYRRFSDSDEEEVDSDIDRDPYITLPFAPYEKLPNLRKITLDGTGTENFNRLLPVKETLLELHASTCNYVKKTGKISELIYLTTLVMQKCRMLKSLAKLDGAVSLEYIDFTECHQLQDVNILGQLSGLRVLKLAKTGINDEGTKSLSALNSLQYLDISECHQLATIDHFVPSLVNLEHLDCHGVSKHRRGVYVGTPFEGFVKTFTTLLPVQMAKNIKYINMLNTKLDFEDLVDFCSSSPENDDHETEATRILVERAQASKDKNNKENGNVENPLKFEVAKRQALFEIKMSKEEVEKANALPADDDFMNFLS